MSPPTALIVSVGSTIQPVVFTLREVNPAFVCFLASQGSVDQIGDIKRQFGRPVTDRKVLVDDPQDLIECYRRSLECLDRAAHAGFATGDTVVDFTGGTKSMTAGLAMAAASRGVRFSYVGGQQRTKGGLGVVESGSEQRREDVSPWRIFAVEEKRRIAQYFNHHQYVAAAHALKVLLPRLVEPDRSLLETIAEAAEGYAAWDRFDHKQALRQLPAARHKLEERSRAATTREYDGMLRTMADNVTALGALEQKPSNLAGDLLANADRRLAEGKFDDAVARLYRTIELLGQCAYRRALGEDTGRTPLGKLPTSIREEFARKYSDDGRTVRLPLYATYQVLDEVGNAAGRRFFEHENEIRKIIDARNHSILAHGMRPIAEGTARKLRDLVAGFLPPEVPRPRFPLLPW